MSINNIMKLTNRGIIDANITVKNQELNPDELHYYRFDLISTDQIKIRYDVGKMVQDWGVNFWFSHTPAGPTIGRYIHVTYQTNISLKVDGNQMTVVERNGGHLETLFDIIAGAEYYINVHNQQNGDNFYWLVVGEEAPLTDLC